MRIFERLLGRDRNKSNIERKVVDTIVGDPLRRIEDETSVPVLPESDSKCCSWCSGEGKAQY